MNYKAFTPTDLPRGVPKYAATVLRDEKGGHLATGGSLEAPSWHGSKGG